MKNAKLRKPESLFLVPLNTGVLLIVSLLFAGVLIIGCKGGNADRNGVDSAMTINDQKIDNKMTAVATNEANFLADAANGGMTEVQAGRIGEEKATNDDVKKFSAKMVEDHTKLNDQLKSLASKLNVTIPAAIDGDSKSMIDKLNSTKSVDFNKTYIDMMVEDHNKDVDAFQKIADNATNPEIHDFVINALPILQTHQQLAKKIQASLK